MGCPSNSTVGNAVNATLTAQAKRGNFLRSSFSDSVR